MISSRPALLFAGLCLSVLLGSLSNGLLNFGDNFSGKISSPGDVDTYEFTAIKGTTVWVSAKTTKPKKKLFPTLELEDQTTGEILAMEGGSSKTASIYKLELPSTGAYALRVGGGMDSTGNYKGKLKGKIDKSSLKFKETVSVDAGGTIEVSFDANKGWELEARFRGKGRSGVFLTNPSLDGPSGPVSLTSFIDENGPQVKIDDLILPELGTYLLAVHNTGLSGLVKWRLELDPDDDDDNDDDDDDDWVDGDDDDDGDDDND
jgi:hypothetical protein